MDDYDERLAYYIEIGAIDPVGLDEDGEVIFQVTEKAKELIPEIWEAHAKYVDETLIELYKKNLISVEYDENLEATITLTEEAKKIAKLYGMIDLDEEKNEETD
jgi:hypothetical protein